MVLITPITLNHIEESAIHITLHRGEIYNPGFFTQHALTKFKVQPVSATAVIETLLLSLYNTKVVKVKKMNETIKLKQT